MMAHLRRLRSLARAVDWPQLLLNRHKRPIASHFHSGGLEFSYLGQDLDEAHGESEETIAAITVRERTAEHLHDVLSGE